MADLSRLKALLESGVTSAKGAYDSLQKQADAANQGLIDSSASMLERAGYSPEEAQERSKNINELSQSGGQSVGAISKAGTAALEGALAKSIAAKSMTPAKELEGLLGQEVLSRFKVRAPALNTQVAKEIPTMPLSKLQEIFKKRSMANMLPEADAALIKSAQDEALQNALLDGIRKSALGK